MPLQLPNLPNFQTNIPQVNPLETYGKMLQLKALQGQQQLLPLEVQQKQQAIQGQQTQNQAAQLQLQREQMALDSQKKLQDAVASGVFNKFAGAETPDGSGFDAAGAYQELVTKHGVLPDQAGPAVQSLLKIGQDMAEQRKTNAQAAEANATVRAKTMDALAANSGPSATCPPRRPPMLSTLFIRIW